VCAAARVVCRSPYPNPKHGGAHEGVESTTRRRQSVYDTPLVIPPTVSPDAADLMVRLLTRRPEHRLGASFGDFKLLMVGGSELPPNPLTAALDRVA
jgi:hypothetical protein